MARIAVVLTLGVLVVAAPALAQRPPSRAALRAMLREAEGHMEAGRHAEAAESFTRLYEGMRSANHPRAAVALWNAGLAMSHLPGREEECLRTLRQFLDDSAPLAEDPEVREFRAGAEAKITEVEARVRANQPPAEAVAPPVQRPEPPPPEAAPAVGAPVPIGPIVMGAGGALLLAAIITGGVALADHDAIDQACAPSGYDAACRLEYADDAARVNELGIATDVLWVLGGLTAGAGLVLMFVLPQGESEEASADAPSVRARLGLGRLSLEGSF